MMADTDACPSAGRGDSSASVASGRIDRRLGPFRVPSLSAAATPAYRENNS